ncbi:MAG: protein-disulfide reductase DsbD family protein [Sandaracinaceae bacterium]
MVALGAVFALLWFDVLSGVDGLLRGMGEAFSSAISSGNWSLALGIAFVAGLGTSLTPCVYPMIAITVSVFGASQAKTKLHAAGLSTMYLLGVCALFTPLGVAAAMTSTVFGAWMSSPWVMFPLALFLAAMAISMFGAFDLALPPALQNRLARMGGIGPRGAFVLGLVMGLIATPCTGPVIGALLAFVAQSQDVVFGGLAFFTFAVGLALPTWFVGTFAMGLPKSGRWLEYVKSAFGIVILAVAIIFVQRWVLETPAAALGFDPLIRRTTPMLILAVVMIAGGLGLGAVTLSYHGASRRTFGQKTLGVALAVLGGVFAAGWVMAPPEGAELAWMTDYEQARSLAERQRQPLLVDFGADWCAACNELERDTFSDPRVVREAQRFVAVRIDMTDPEDDEERLLSGYEQRGLPLVVMHGSSGEEEARVVSFVEADEMLELMRRVN